MSRTGQLVPTRARRTELPGAGAPLAALEAGPVGGEPVLLLPGFTGSKEDFTPLLDPLGDAGYRVIALDLPGQFESPGPADPDEYSADRLAETVLAAVASLSGPVHLIGHSFGGLVARAAVIARPSRFADLVLMSSGPAAIQGLRRQRIDDLAPLLDAGLEAVYEAMQAAIEAEPGYEPPPVPLAAFLRRRFLSGSPAMLAGMSAVLRTEPDRVEQLATAGVRTLVLFGSSDDAWPPHVQRAMATRLGAQVAEIADAAHSPAVENTADTARALLAFWAG